MAERKVFDVLKHIPIFGAAYAVIRGAAYGLADDEGEMKHSWEMDLANLNPLRIPRNILNDLYNCDHDLDGGIWIGKRGLGDQLFGLTFSPGSDIHHWCIQINGIIYELAGTKKSNIRIDIISKPIRPKQYQEYCKRFSWTWLQNASSSVSNSTLRDYARSFENYTYHAFLPSGHKINCQYFVLYMYAKAANITIATASERSLLIMPNILF